MRRLGPHTAASPRRMFWDQKPRESRSMNWSSDRPIPRASLEVSPLGDRGDRGMYGVMAALALGALIVYHTLYGKRVGRIAAAHTG